MTTIAVAIDRFDGVLTLSAAIDFGSLPAPITIDSEALLVTGGDNQKRISVNRGMNGTAPASHALNATVTEGWSTGGSGGVIVDNTVDPPFAASTLVMPGATESAADEATLATILQRSVTLTDAEIKAWPGTRHTLIPAPGPTKFIVTAAYNSISPGQIAFVHHHVADYVNVNVGAAFLVELGTNAASAQMGGTGPGLDDMLVWGAPDDLFFVPDDSGGGGVIPNGAADWLDKPVTIQMLNGTPDDGPLTGGDPANTFTIHIWYAIVDISA